MSVKITVKELATEARKQAEHNPSNKVSCTYVCHNDGERRPNCVVGKALHALGVSLESLELWNATAIRALLDEHPEWLSDEVMGNRSVYVWWLAQLQYSQDDGFTWGESLAIADRQLVMGEFGI